MIDRILSMFRVGRIRLVDDSGTVRRLQIDEGDLGAYGGRRLIDKVAHITQFGLASVPPLDAEALLLSLQGDRSQTIAFGTSHQPSRPRNLQPGDGGIYDVRGASVLLTAEGITVNAAGLAVTVTNATKLRVDAPLIECTGDIVSRADGQRVSLNALCDAYNQHHHSGVAAGSALSGITDRTV